nr:hypothetical protein CFP56_00459 [Quercus suber]
MRDDVGRIGSRTSIFLIVVSRPSGGEYYSPGSKRKGYPCRSRLVNEMVLQLELRSLLSQSDGSHCCAWPFVIYPPSPANASQLASAWNDNLQVTASLLVANYIMANERHLQAVGSWVKIMRRQHHILR